MPKFNFKLTRFDKLMPGRIHNVLLICSSYDYFTLNVEGRIEEQLYDEYKDLNLVYSPRIVHVRTAEDALANEAETIDNPNPAKTYGSLIQSQFPSSAPS